ncbi:MAG: DUF1631 domain-containing protein [Proteobacteria bacterium]|nr:DUF1631 domain-containing protein [Pseudomonadota bacterium]
MNDEKEQIASLATHRKNQEVSDFGELLPQILTKFVIDLKPKLILCFESLDDTLFDLAEKADSNQKQTLYFESMRNVRKSRNKIFIGFFKQIKKTFISFKKNEFDFFKVESVDTDQDSLSLSLIDEKELDETLAKINLIQKSEMVYHRHIFALKKRFSLLASGSKLSAEQIPISPYVLVNSFANSIKVLDMDVTTKLVLYKLFERCVMGQLNGFYNLINDLLVDKGILPEIKYNIGRSAQRSGQPNNNLPQKVPSDENQLVDQYEASQLGDGDSQGGNYNASEQQNIDPNYQIISQLFKRSHQQNDGNVPFNNVSNSNNPSMPALGIHPPGANIGMGSMMNALSILQSEVLGNIENSHYSNKSPIEIKNDLINQLHKLDENSKDKKVRQKDEDTINLVALLFQFIVEDRNLPDSIQVILARLQIPYLKIALQDSHLFADKAHPARTLLDKLSLASVGWNESTDRNNRFISKLEQVVYDILDLDEYGHEIFIVLQADFERFLKQLNKKSDVLQRRTQQKTIGQEKISQAKEYTAQLLVDKMTNKQMPILVRDILLGEWSNVLVLMHLRHATDSEEYQQKVLFIDEVIKYCVPINDTKVTKNDVQKLTKLYKTGLDLLAFQAKELIDKQHKLVRCIYEVHNIDLLHKDNQDPVEFILAEEILELSENHKQHEIAEYIEKIIAPSEDIQVYEDINDEFSEMVSTLEVSTWMEFLQSDKMTIRAKLSWISPITGKYLFVNSRGLKTSDKTKLALAEGFRNSTIRLLEKIALFDRALDSIAKNLEKETTKPENSTTKD